MSNGPTFSVTGLVSHTQQSKPPCLTFVEPNPNQKSPTDSDDEANFSMSPQRSESSGRAGI